MIAAAFSFHRKRERSMFIISENKYLRHVSRMIRVHVAHRPHAFSSAAWIACGALIVAHVAVAVEPAVWKFEDLHGKRFLRPSDAVDVALAEADRERIDSWVGDRGVRIRVRTGPAWAMTFRGDLAKDPVLTLRSVSVVEETVPPGYVARMVYEIEATVALGDRETTIRATGRESSSRAGIYAIRGAVEKCIKEAATAAKEAAARLAPH